MIRFEKLSVPETIYPFIDAEAADDYVNGTFGKVENDKFTAGSDGFQVIMQVEKGHNANTDKFTVKKGERVRVADLTKADGQIVDITSDMLPDGESVKDIKVGAKLVPDTDNGKKGLLKANGDEANHLTVIEVTDFGVRAVVELKAVEPVSRLGEP